MSIKNGVYLQVFFSQELKDLLERFSKKVSMSQSKICRQILEIELPLYMANYLNKMEEKNETS